MDANNDLERLLHAAAELDTEAVADVPGLVRRGRRAQLRRRALRAGGVAMVVVLAGVAVSAADSDTSEDVSTVDGPTDRDDRREGDRPEPSPSLEVEPVEEPTTTTSANDAGERTPPPTTTTTVPSDPGPLRLTVSPGTMAPYGTLSVRSVDPCPAGTTRVRVEVGAIGGSMDGTIVGGDDATLDAAGHWSLATEVVAVGGIENVAWAMTAPELEVRTTCTVGRFDIARYGPARIHHGRVAVVPELTATWDGQRANLEFSGCPNAYYAYLSWGDAPPPPGRAFTPNVIGVATPGPDPDTWIATIDAPGYDPADGLWASAFCNDAGNVTSIWRYLPFELDPPG